MIHYTDNYDTAGTPIKEFIDMCDCGLTGGCEKCNPNLDWHYKYIRILNYE